MSAVGDYIHYQYSHFTGEDSPEQNATRLSAIYNQTKIQHQYNLSLKELNGKLKQIYASKMKNVSNNKKGEEEFFKLLSDLQNNILNKAANKMVENLGTTNLGYSDLYGVEQDMNKLQSVLDIFSKITTQITNSSFSNNPIAILTVDMLKGDTSSSNIKNIFREAYLTDGQTFKVDGSYGRAIKSHQNEINKVLAGLSALKSIKEGSMKNFDTSIKSEVIISLVMSIWSTLNRIVGFVSEDILTDAIEEFILSEMKNIGENITVVAEGTGSGSIFSKKTEDVSLKLDLKKMLKGEGQGEISFNLPGITLKRTNIKQNNIAKVHIKSDAVLSNFLDNMNMSVKLSEFYHAYADYNMAIKRKKGRALPAELNKSAAAGMMNMYNYFHAAMLPMALAGSLDKDDFAYFMIINDKVYNVIEIVQKVANNKDFSFVSSNLGTSQTGIKNAHNGFYQPETDPLSNIEGDRRSDLILSRIRSLKVTMELNLALSKI